MMQRITPGVAFPTNMTTTPTKVANAARTRHQTSDFEVSPRTRIGLDIRKIQSVRYPTPPQVLVSTQVPKGRRSKAGGASPRNHGLQAIEAAKRRCQGIFELRRFAAFQVSIVSCTDTNATPGRG